MRTWMLPGVIALGLATAGEAHAAPPVGPPAPKAAPGAPGDDMIVMMGQHGRGRLGVEIVGISDELRAYFGAPAGTGVLINRVQDGTPAKAAGLRPGDVIVEVAGAKVEHGGDVVGALADKKKGDAVAVTVVRDKKRVALKATMDDAPAAMAMGGFDLPGGMRWHGAPGPGGGKAFEHWQKAWGGAELEKRMETLEKRLESLEKKR